MMFLGMFGVTSTTDLIGPARSADAGTWLYPQSSWSAYGVSARHWSRAWADRWSSWKAHSEVNSAYMQAWRVSGASVNRARVTMRTEHSGGAVAISKSGPGFSSFSSGCEAGWWNSRVGSSSVVVDFGSSVICHAESWTYTGQVTVTTMGGVRVGDTWTVRTSSRSW